MDPNQTEDTLPVPVVKIERVTDDWEYEHSHNTVTPTSESRHSAQCTCDSAVRAKLEMNTHCGDGTQQTLLQGEAGVQDNIQTVGVKEEDEVENVKCKVENVKCGGLDSETGKIKAELEGMEMREAGKPVGLDFIKLKREESVALCQQSLDSTCQRPLNAFSMVTGPQARPSFTDLTHENSMRYGKFPDIANHATGLSARTAFCAGAASPTSTASAAAVQSNTAAAASLSTTAADVMHAGLELTGSVVVSGATSLSLPVISGSGGVLVQRLALNALPVYPSAAHSRALMDAGLISNFPASTGHQLLSGISSAPGIGAAPRQMITARISSASVVVPTSEPLVVSSKVCLQRCKPQTLASVAYPSGSVASPAVNSSSCSTSYRRLRITLPHGGGHFVSRSLTVPYGSTSEVVVCADTPPKGTPPAKPKQPSAGTVTAGQHVKIFEVAAERSCHQQLSGSASKFEPRQRCTPVIHSKPAFVQSQGNRGKCGRISEIAAVVNSNTVSLVGTENQREKLVAVRANRSSEKQADVRNITEVTLRKLETGAKVLQIPTSGTCSATHKLDVLAKPANTSPPAETFVNCVMSNDTRLFPFAVAQQHWDHGAETETSFANLRLLLLDDSALNATSQTQNGLYVRLTPEAAATAQSCVLIPTAASESLNGGQNIHIVATATTAVATNNVTMAAQGMSHYFCKECAILFDSASELKVHKTAHNHVQVIYKCPSCPATFDTFIALESHIKNHTAEDMLEESEPEQAAEENATAELDTPEPPDLETGNDAELEENPEPEVDLEENPEPEVDAEQHYCCVCGRGYGSTDRLQLHKQSKHPGIRHRNCEGCDTDDRTSGRSLSAPRKRRKLHSTCYCPICETDGIDDLLLHMQEHHDLDSDSSDTDSGEVWDTEEESAEEKERESKEETDKEKTQPECQQGQSESPVSRSLADSSPHAETCSPTLRAKHSSQSETCLQTETNPSIQAEASLQTQACAIKSPAESETETKEQTASQSAVQSDSCPNPDRGEAATCTAGKSDADTMQSKGPGRCMIRCPLCAAPFLQPAGLLQHIATHADYKDYIERCAALYSTGAP